MKVIMIISIIIVFVVLLLAVLTTSKAYSFKHTIDPIDELPDGEDKQEPKKAGTDL
ncbi:YtzI protein [Neobacillus sp. LXY-4]|uniref:YtzI protein n=1 Tax=Neobacillus sp. LXY-4 TaxID=3379826 RepID=UPI003EE3F314